MFNQESRERVSLVQLPQMRVPLSCMYSGCIQLVLTIFIYSLNVIKCYKNLPSLYQCSVAVTTFKKIRRLARTPQHHHHPDEKSLRPAAYIEGEFYARSDGFEPLDFSSSMTMPQYKRMPGAQKVSSDWGTVLTECLLPLNLTRFLVPAAGLASAKPNLQVGQATRFSRGKLLKAEWFSQVEIRLAKVSGTVSVLGLSPLLSPQDFFLGQLALRCSGFAIGQGPGY